MEGACFIAHFLLFFCSRAYLTAPFLFLFVLAFFALVFANFLGWSPAPWIWLSQTLNPKPSTRTLNPNPKTLNPKRLWLLRLFRLLAFWLLGFAFPARVVFVLLSRWGWEFSCL